MTDIKVGDIVMFENIIARRPHVVEVVRDNGKVVLRDLLRGGKGVTVKITNIGSGRGAGTTYYREEPRSP